MVEADREVLFILAMIVLVMMFIVNTESEVLFKVLRDVTMIIITFALS